MFWRIPSSHGACHVFHHILRDRTTPFFFLIFSGCRLYSLPCWGVAGSQQGFSHSRWARLSSPNRSPYTKRPPKHRHILSAQSIRAGQMTAELSLSSGLLFATCLPPPPPMKPTPCPRAVTGARVSREQMEFFPVFLMWPTVLATSDCLCESSMWTLCHPP